MRGARQHMQPTVNQPKVNQLRHRVACFKAILKSSSVSLFDSESSDARPTADAYASVIVQREQSRTAHDHRVSQHEAVSEPFTYDGAQ
jgi:hypothetical protein